MNNTIKVKIIILFLVSITLYSNANQIFKQIKDIYGLMEIDAISANEYRFRELKKILPSQAILGYISNTENKSIFKDINSTSDYLFTQYVLSPRIIYNNTKYPYIIGNFTNERDPNEILRKNNLKVIKNFGNGVMLLKSGDS